MKHHTRRLLGSILEAAGLSTLALVAGTGCGPLQGGGTHGDSQANDETAASSDGMTSGDPTTSSSWPDDSGDDPYDCPESTSDGYLCYLPDAWGESSSSGSTSDGSSSTSGGPENGSSGSTGGTWETSSGSDGGSSTTGSVDESSTGDLCAAYVGNPPPFPSDCGLSVYSLSGPIEDDGECCYKVRISRTCCGRPFTVSDNARTSKPVVNAEWLGRHVPALDELDVNERKALGGAWLEDALAEHASVASFSRFVLQLLAVGAPSELVLAAQRAIADEVHHARMCFALASHYAEEPLGPGPIDITGALDEHTDLASIVRCVIREGCVGETLAALQAFAAADGARDPAVRSVLQTIAEDELRHAELGWRFVRWALERGDEDVRTVATDAFDTALASLPVPPSLSVCTEQVAAHGRLSPQALTQLYRDGLRQVVEPAARSLLDVTRCSGEVPTASLAGRRCS
jgi:hypothetical protein